MNMYKFQGALTVWVVAYTEERAIDMYKSYYGEDSWEEGKELYGKEAIILEDEDAEFTYYDINGVPIKTSFREHIRRCGEEDIYAESLL